VARKKIEIHETKSAPEYEKWFHSTFGKELTEIRELSQKIAQQKELIDSVYSESYLSGCSKRQAYNTIMQTEARFEEIRQKHQAKARAQESTQKQNPDPDSLHQAKQKEESLQEELLRAAFEMMFGTKQKWQSKEHTYEEAFENFKKKVDQDHQSQEDDSFEEEKNDFPEDIAHSTARPLRPRLKEVYRYLVRKLHPDINPDTTPRKTELWHQVQKAYESQDLERLETLTALSEMLDKTWEKVESISTVKGLFKDLLSALKQLERRIRRERKSAAWKFHEKMKDPFKLKSLKSQSQRSLFKDYQILKRQNLEFESLIQEWSRPSKNR
jgi:hypothetical protein